ncbi:coiled-coil domain-containing protein 87-like isoform X2 [Hydractinia symbiolongicarpus]|uniref:coiled-coil domain-containing protein 87-like isoform X2 n=1 Tax=Hydractinia symbiolongicarpus TaxID=13093 RepID=UPI002551C2B9|nr:coiled-coil domain-containing protein 87-like isoform X2 [Hydractinia symbiolongicarpus]
MEMSNINESATLTAQQFYEKFKGEDISIDLFADADDKDNERSVDLKKNTSRVVTPIDQTITHPPSTHTELTKCFRERLSLQVDLEHVTTNDQTQLIDVLTMAIVSVWPEHRKQAPDPFLSDYGNMELQRRVATHVIQTAEYLFYSYIAKAEELNKKAVFSSQANISRLKTQILHEANKSLNILDIRRKLAEEMRRIPNEKWFQQPGTSDITLFSNEEDASAHYETSYQLFVQTQLNEMENEMPNIKLRIQETHYSLHRLEGHKASADLSVRETAEDKAANSSNLVEKTELIERDISVDDSKDSVAVIQRSGSMPTLTGEVTKMRKISVNQLVGQNTPNTNSDRIKDDLTKLLKTRSENDDGGRVYDDDFSSLLEVSERRRKKEQRVDKLEKKVENSSADCEDKNELFPLNSDCNSCDDQTSVLNVKIPNYGIARICDVAVSDCINETKLILQKYAVLYNEFLDEINKEMAKSLDKHLFADEEVKDVYDELSKTMNKDHLCFDKDAFVEPCPLNLSRDSVSFVSAMLQGKQQSRVANEDLRCDAEPPWVNHVSAVDWRNEPRFAGIGREDILKMDLRRRSLANPNKSAFFNGKDTSSINKLFKEYNAWLAWYKSTLNTDDYRKFLSLKENDFLSQIYHLYDSEDEELEEEKAKISVQMKILQERTKQKKELRAVKTKYEEGFWNVQTVLLGGLGKDPSVNVVDIVHDDSETRKNEKNLTSSYILLQERLEHIWTALKMSEEKRLDMAMKYKSLEAIDTLSESLKHWEDVTSLIVEREGYMAKLEHFERTASDPNRFFEKGFNGSSLARINEAKTRGKLNKRIKTIDETLTNLLRYIKKHFNDDVTYHGRNYLEKMQSDRVEMLYWLQQERRKTLMNTTGQLAVSCGEETTVS